MAGLSDGCWHDQICHSYILRQFYAYIYRESANILPARLLLHLLLSIETLHFDQFLQYIPNHLQINPHLSSLAPHTPLILHHIRKKSPLQARRICVSQRGMLIMQVYCCTSHCTYFKGYWRDCGLAYISSSGLLGAFSSTSFPPMWKC